MQDKEVLAIVMKKVPSKYSTILAAESVRLGAGFSVKEAKVALMTLYRAGHKEEEEETEEEVVLNASFTCYECGQKGHKASECPQRKLNDRNKGSTKKPRFQGTCFQCGKTGHRKEDCFQNPNNKKPRPKWWKGSKGKESLLSQTAAAGQDQDGVEILLVSVDQEIPCSQNHVKRGFKNGSNAWRIAGSRSSRNIYCSSEAPETHLRSLNLRGRAGAIYWKSRFRIILLKHGRWWW